MGNVEDKRHPSFIDTLIYLRKHHQLKAIIHNNFNLEFNFLFEKLLLDEYISFSYPDVEQWEMQSTFLGKMVWVILQQVNTLQQIGESSKPPQNNFAMYFNVNDTLEISSADNCFKDEIVMHNLKLWKVNYMQLIEYFKFDNAGSG